MAKRKICAFNKQDQIYAITIVCTVKSVISNNQQNICSKQGILPMNIPNLLLYHSYIFIEQPVKLKHIITTSVLFFCRELMKTLQAR